MSLSMGMGLYGLRSSGSAFSPNDYNPWAWWDAFNKELNGSDVSELTDRSGNGNHMTQGNASLQPAFLSDRGGYPAVYFDTTTKQLLNSSISFNYANYTIFYVYEHVGSGGVQILIGNATTDFGISATQTTTWRTYINSTAYAFTVSSGLFTGSDHLIYTQRNGTAMNAEVDESSIGTDTVSGSGSLTTMALLGNGTTAYFRAAIVYDSVLTADQIQDVEDYLTTEWGL